MNLIQLRGSLRSRLLLGTLFWIAASIVVAGWGLGRLFHQHVSAQFHAQLTMHLDQLTSQLSLGEGGQPALAMPLSDPRLNKPLGGLYWQIDRIPQGDFHPGIASPTGISAGHTDFPAKVALLRSRSLWDQTLQVPADNTLADGEIHQHRIVGPQNAMLGMVERRISLEGQPLRLIVAADERLLLEPVAQFNDQLRIALSLLAAGLALAAWLQVMIGLAPLRALHAALARVHSGANKQMDGQFPAEIMPLVTEFNSVLMENLEVVERARTQAGNLAHALKTPLSVLANAAASSTANINAGVANERDLAGLVAAQVDIARQQVDFHLARAQSAARARLPGLRTPVAAVIDGLVRAMRRIHGDRHLDLVVQSLPETPLVFRGEAQDLQEMLGNLIDNACKWAHSRVEVQVRSEQNRLVIVVDDDGRGIPVDQRDAMLRRGIRADQQVPGTGLGLSIVDDLARMYGGQLQLADSPLRGLRAVLALPEA